MNIANHLTRAYKNSVQIGIQLSLTGVLLVLSACGGGNELKGDTDGDGLLPPTDCDNLDASIHPGAVDVCTDAIDQDCSGSALKDCDGDGVEPPADCNDSDKTVYPGAPEKDYDGIDQDCSGSDNDDKDFDGHRSERVGGDDCNDLDNTVYPGAEEVAYDGIDQDCLNGDLVDVDGDGFAGIVEESSEALDCQDQNDTIYPGAVEVPYDKVDQDCSSADLTDVDGDGYDAVVAGGTDCQDLDPKSYPGAVEVPYDAIDQDCSGADLVDGDGDGFELSQDCDDTQASISPSASEITCNDIDENCDGLRRDQDCDGYVSLSEGGNDCNDLSPQIHVQALEERNGVDDNCDGAVDETVSVSRASATILTTAKMHTGAAMRSADLDGDGHNELIFGAPGYSDAEGAGRGLVYIVPGTAEGLTSLDLTSDPGQVLTVKGTGEGDGFGTSLAVTDLDQDGRLELLVGAPHALGPSGHAGALYIFPGYQQLWNQNPRADQASYILYGTQDDGQFGSVLEVMGDVDGQGHPDFMVSAPDAAGNNPPEAGRSWLFAGERLSLLQSVSDAIFSVTGTVPHAHLGASLGGAADFNRDGFNDVVVGVPGQNSDNGSVLVFFGRSDMSQVSGSTPDAVLTSESTLDEKGNLGSVITPGDVNGDGYDDLVVSAPNAGGDGSGRVFFLFGRTDRWAGAIDLSRRSNGLLEGEHAGDGLGAQLGSGLINDDDLPDVLVGTHPGSEASLYLFAGRSGTNYDVLSVSSALASFNGDENRPLSGSVLTGDFDRDGLADLILAGRSSDAELTEYDTLFIFQWQ